MKIKDKYYRNVERLLYNYNMLKANVETLDRELILLRELYPVDGVKGIAYDGVPSQTNKINNPTESEAIPRLEIWERLKKRREETQKVLDILDRFINELNEVERKIIRMYYIEGKRWWEIAYEVQYNERHCRRIRTEAIGKLAVGLYGKEAIEE